MKLLDTTASNPKIKKTLEFMPDIRIATLSMKPDRVLCPSSKAAGCEEICLQHGGLSSVFPSVEKARSRKSQFYHNDREGFLAQLNRELTNFDKLCKRTNVKGWVRLNVFSDVAWEDYNIPQTYPDLTFYDYTKRAARLNSIKVPSNYKLIFSYSGEPLYRNQVKIALKTDAPIAVVFKDRIPTYGRFLERKIINGDLYETRNAIAKNYIVGLSLKGNEAKKISDTSRFVVVN